MKILNKFCLIMLILLCRHYNIQTMMPKSLVCQTLQKSAEMILQAPDKEQALRETLSKMPKELQTALEYLVKNNNDVSQAYFSMLLNDLNHESNFFYGCNIDFNFIENIVKEVKNYGKSHALYSLIVKNQIKEAKFILESKDFYANSDIDFRHAEMAFIKKNPEILSLIIKKGVNVNENKGWLLSNTIKEINNLHDNEPEEKKQLSLKMLKTLIDLGADPNIETDTENESFLDRLVFYTNDPNNQIIFQARKILIGADAKSKKNRKN